MPCYTPHPVYISEGLKPNGKKDLKWSDKLYTYNESPGWINEGYQRLLGPQDSISHTATYKTWRDSQGRDMLYKKSAVPCGKCLGCREKKLQEWSIRCYHESKLYQFNTFITLTYNDENLPQDGQLRIDHWQKFMKRLRKRYGSGIRYFHCGEYGDKFGRPHYHALLFNFHFKDRKLIKENNGVKTYVSQQLTNLWPYGFSAIGNVTLGSIMYVAGYVYKKKKEVNNEYTYMDETGSLKTKQPVYATMSRRPGIGKIWYDKYNKEVHTNGFLTINGRKYSIPSYYEKIFSVRNPDLYNVLLDKKRLYIESNIHLYTRESLQTKYVLHIDRLKRTKPLLNLQL